MPELMVTLLILAILLSVAVPSFDAVVGRQELRSKTDLLTSTIAYARNEAVARVASVVMCGSTDAQTCNNTSDWSQGWLVFLDKNDDGVLNLADGDEILKRGGDGGGSISVALSDSEKTIEYSEQGESSEARRIFMCASNADGNEDRARTVSVSVVGSTRVSTGGNCSASSGS